MHCVAHDSGEVDLRPFEGHLTGLQARDEEQVVHEREQSLGGQLAVGDDDAVDRPEP